MAVKNILTNPSFDGIGNWRFSYTDGMVSDGNARTGSKCLRFTYRDGGRQQSAYQEVNLVRGKSYTLTLWAKRQNINSIYQSMLVYSHLMYLDSNGNPAWLYSPSLIPDYVDGYQQCTWTITIPSNACSTTAILYIHCGAPKFTIDFAPRVWVDDVALTGEDAASIAPVRPPDTGTPSGVDVVRDGEFETTNTWSCHDTTIEPGDQHSGVSCLNLRNRSTGGQIFADQSVPLVAGSNYTLSFYAKRRGQMEIWTGVTFMDANGNWTSINSNSLLNQTFEEYRRLSWSFTFPVGAQYAWLRFYGAGQPGDAATAFVDDVVLVGPSTIPSGKRWAYINEAGTRLRDPANNDYAITKWYPNARFVYQGSDVFANKEYLRMTWPPDAFDYARVAKSSVVDLGAVTTGVKDTVLCLAASYYQATQNNPSFPMNGATFGLGGNWCAVWLEWLCVQAGMVNAGIKLPGEAMVKDALTYFHYPHSNGRFWFTSAFHKKRMREIDPVIRQYTDFDELSDDEQRFVPQAGDWVFIRWNNKDETMSHVGIVAVNAPLNPTSVTTYEGNISQKVVNETRFIRNIDKNDEVVGFGRLKEW